MGVSNQRKRMCQHFEFVVDRDVISDHALEGHVFERHIVTNAAQCHVMCKGNCRCISMNYLSTAKGNNCELNDENVGRRPDALKYKYKAHYYGLVRSYTMEGGRKHVLGNDYCVNRCCQSKPCLHGGECREICDPKDARFKCSCPANYTGKRCETRCYKSCLQAFQFGIRKSGMYAICEVETIPFYVYCDMESETNFVWNLIQSFALDQKNFLRDKGFGVDFPVGENLTNIDWTFYRLSLSRMECIRTKSSHLRVTCNFREDGLQYVDYARTMLKNHDIFSTFNGVCKWYEYINIRGIECHNCTAITSQRKGRPWFINSYTSNSNGCDFNGKPGMGTYEQNFGWYEDRKVNKHHRCSSSPSSTTEHWLGSKK